MFEQSKNRYITRGIKEGVTLELQVFCWELINKKKSENNKVELDYLQIFEINPNISHGRVEVIHRQEEPFFIEYHDVKMTIDIQKCDVRKLWVIDDGINQTMLLPEEY